MSSPRLSERSDVDAFLALDMLREANLLQAAGHRIVHLEIGQPSAPAPERVRAAASRAIADEKLGYTEALGTNALRGRIARHYRDAYGCDVDPARIVITPGSSGAFMLAFLACFNPGDRVALVSPGYPAYRHILRTLGLEPVPIPVGPETRWAPTPEMIAETEKRAGRLAGLLIASPANPTGTMLDRAHLASLVDEAASAGRWFISDEIYHRVTFGDPAVTALALNGDAVVINSFSKYYCMTGWRLGWMVVPERMARAAERLAQSLYISPSTLAQAAALAAFDASDELDAHVDLYRRNRDFLLNGLREVGLDRVSPADGAFYLYVDISQHSPDAHDFCRRMLHEAHIAATPGQDFDPDRGHKFIRLSFAGSAEDMHEAVHRLRRWL